MEQVVAVMQWNWLGDEEDVRRLCRAVGRAGRYGKQIELDSEAESFR